MRRRLFYNKQKRTRGISGPFEQRYSDFILILGTSNLGAQIR